MGAGRGLAWLLLPVDVPAEVERFIVNAYLQRLRRGVLFGCALLLIAIPTDLAAFGAIHTTSAVTNIASAATCVWIYYRLASQRTLIGLTKGIYLIAIMVSANCGIATYLLGGVNSPWAYSNGLMILISGAVAPLPGRIVTVFSVIGFAGYLAAALAVGLDAATMGHFVAHLLFYAAFIALAVITASFQYRLTVRTVKEMEKLRNMAGALKTHQVALAQMQSELEERKAATVDMGKAQSEFLSNISHELRTPLTSILGFSSFLENSGAAMKPGEADMLRRIRGQGEALLGVVENLIDLAAISFQKTKLDPKPLHAAALIRHVVDAHEEAALEAGHEVITELPGGDGAVEGDYDRLILGIGHLLANAIKFTPNGGVLRVGFRCEGKMLELFVKDNGPGIDPDMMETIFQIFRQEDGSANRRHGGMGIGLTIVQAIAQMHGGSVRASSSPGQGAEFVISLPKAGSRAIASA